MPLPLLMAALPAIASAAGSAFNQAQNNNAINRTNQQNEAWSRELYEKQKQDNLNQWHLQNEYNSPVSQMARLKEAGLNPNLVYAKGADNVSAPIATPTAAPVNRTPNQYGNIMESGLDAYYNYQIKEAQVDNLKVQNTVAFQEAALKAATTANTIQSTARSKFDLEYATEMRQNSADFAREGLRKLQADTSYQISENERRNITTSQSLQESAERILTSRLNRAQTQEQIKHIRAQIDNVKNSTELQRLDIELRKMGIQPNDPIYFRALGRALGTDNAFQKIDSKTREVSSDFKKWIQNYSPFK